MQEKKDNALAVKEETMPEINDTDNVFRRHMNADPNKQKIAKHRIWMDAVQHEYPMPYMPYKIGVYIRYYNQTKHKNYIEKHVQNFSDDIALCEKWTLVDFYIDEGMNAPRMENAKEWCRLFDDVMSGKVNLIVTQKVSNVSSDPEEITLIARLLAAHNVGIYFISEDIFTLASYYRTDLKDKGMFPSGWRPLPDDEIDAQLMHQTSGLLEGASQGENANGRTKL